MDSRPILCSVVDPSYSEEEGATQEDENTGQEQPGEGAEPGENFSMTILTLTLIVEVLRR